MNNYPIFFILLFILLCIQIYWIIQILFYKDCEKRHIYLVLTFLFINLFLLFITLKSNIFFNLFSELFLGILIVLLYIFSIYYLALDIQKIKNSISNQSIREALNSISAGLCFYDDSGLPLLMNEMIESISQEILGDTLSNGIEFWNAINSTQEINGKRIHAANPTILSNSEKVYSFSNQNITLGKENIHQVLVSDVTDLYTISKKIEEDNKILSTTNKGLREYNTKISILIRNEEILRSKIRIHDNLGHSIISTKYYLSNSESNIDKDQLLNSWRTNIALLNKEKIKEHNDIMSILQNAANAIGLKLIIDGDISNWNITYQKIIITAIKECMTNAVQHSKATKLNVKIEENKNYNTILIMNNGIQPKNIVEGGGLTSLRAQVEHVHGEMNEVFDNQFILIIKLPSKEIRNV